MDAPIKPGSVIFRLSGLSINIENTSSEFQKELKRLLQLKRFLPGGGTLGFGLVYIYNWSETDGHVSGAGIAGLYNMLKPADKLLYTIGATFKLSPKLKVVYRLKDYPGVSFLSTNLSPFPGEPYPYGPTWENTGGLRNLCEKIGGEIIESPAGLNNDKLGAEVSWVKPVEYVNSKSQYIEQVAGKKIISSVSRSYVLTMTVPGWPERQKMGI